MRPRDPDAKNRRFAPQLITGDNTFQMGEKAWDRFFDTPKYVYGKEPTPFLRRNLKRIRTGNALVLAMSEGRDAVFLARQGFKVDGVDISGVAIRKAARLSNEYNVKINAIQASIKDFPIKPKYYDLILTVTYFRADVIPAIRAGLKPGGVAIFENYLETDKPQNTDNVPLRFRVRRGELKELFKGFEIIEYVEYEDNKIPKVNLLARKSF